MSSLPSSRQLNVFYLLSWLLAVAQLAALQTAQQFTDPIVAGWTVVAILTYAWLYLAPAMLLGHLLRRAPRAWARLPGGPRAFAALVIGLSGATHVLLHADRVIFGMYGFHINGFVVNLVLTPGGIASLGASTATALTAGAIAAALVALHVAAYAWIVRRAPAPQEGTRPSWRWALAAFVALTIGERVAYGYSEMTNFQPILFASERMPLYQPLTFRKFAQRLGVAAVDGGSERLRVTDGPLAYPLSPLKVQAPAHPLNVVWLVAESLRFDMLDPAIMPRVWALSQDAVRLEKHFSGSNMTQMGVFSMFYGLYGNYWFPMLAARRAPLLMDVMQQQGYEFSINTSQRFTYPAFDKTVFANLRPQDLHAREGGAPAWQRDVQNIDDLIGFIDRRDPARPFMTYMFFESTHANYNFPPEAALAGPYLEDFNYLTADFAADIALIRNRYVNAAHHVDAQIGRLVDHLRQRGLLEDTIVVVLGDHGEEFMERGRWGHGAEFNRFQTGTPGVIRVPGRASAVIRGITSHLDIPATLMPLLGVQNPPEDYCLGHDLLAADFHRDYAVGADWNRIAYIGDDYKIAFPLNAVGAARNAATDGDDRPLPDTSRAVRAIRASMVEIMGNLARFKRRPG
jgi:hypothetical protein